MLSMSKKWNKILWGVLFAVVLGFSLYRKIQTVGNIASSVDIAELTSEEVTSVEDAEIADSSIVEEVASVIDDVQSDIGTVTSTIADIVQEAEQVLKIKEDGSYNSKEDVSLYIYTYSHLPDNYITKKEAQALGWNGGSLEPYAPGKSIGGDRFGNREGVLPKKSGRNYTECDIDTRGKKSRGAKRIVFSNDGLIYYTEDHYESFEILYGDE